MLGGGILELKNTMRQHHGGPAELISSSEVARVGTEGDPGGQAEGKGVSGTWKDLTDSVNFMAGNLPGQGATLRRGHHGGCSR